MRDFVKWWCLCKFSSMYLYISYALVFCYIQIWWLILSVCLCLCWMSLFQVRQHMMSFMMEMERLSLSQGNVLIDVTSRHWGFYFTCNSSMNSIVVLCFPLSVWLFSFIWTILFWAKMILLFIWTGFIMMRKKWMWAFLPFWKNFI